MLTIFRRHRKACPHQDAGRKYRRCQCRISVEGLLGGKLIRRSLRLRDWAKAQDLVRQWEAEGRQTIEQQSQAVSIGQAAGAFMADARARKLNEATLYKYELLFRQLQDFAARMRYELLRDLDASALTAFRSEWKDGPRSGLKKLERLRAFLGFCQKRRLVADNPATELKPPKIIPRPTMPFMREEMLRILAAVDKYAERAGTANAHRLRAFVLLLRYSGMRIGDAVACGTDRLVGNRLFLYTQKTGVPVRCILPDFVALALEAAPRGSERYWFWSGQSKLHSAIGKWQRRLANLFRLAEVRAGHAHRFRDTFAVELLLEGVPIERVSVLLGHQSIRVTERHYAPWVRARQEQLEADLERAWSRDPVVQLHTNHTKNTHGKSERPN